MSSSAPKAITVVTIGVTVTVSVLTYRTVTQEQLNAMEQCAPNCEFGAPLISLPEFAFTAFLVLAVVLVASSLVSGWPFGGQLR